MTEEKDFYFLAFYNATVIEKLCVVAENKEEAIQKIKDCSVDVDIIDEKIEYEDFIGLEEL